MASTKKQLLISIVLMAIAVSVTFLLYLNRPPTQIADPEYQPVSVDVAEVVKENITIEVQAQGTVTPLRQSSLMSEVQGRVIEVSPNFNVGGFVAADDMLLRIDPRDYETNLLRAKAAVESAESALAQEQGRAMVAKREWEKLPTGSQRSQQARELYLRQPQLEQAEAQLLAAQADLNTARDNLDRTTIRAPYDALIRGKHSDLGQFVSPGSPLADIFAIESAEVRLPIAQSRLEYLDLPGISGTENGSPIDLYTDVGGELRHWQARLHRTEGVFDERSRALFAVARIDDPYGVLDPDADQLRIGTFVNANIQGRELEDIVRLPRFVLRAGNYVWVVDENSRLRNRKVSLLRVGGDIIYVSAGLDEGEQVSLTTLDSSFDTAEVIVHSSTPTDQLDKATVPGIAEPEDSSATTTAAALAPSAASADG